MPNANEAKLDELALRKVLMEYDADEAYKVSHHQSMLQIAPSSQRASTVVGDLSVLLKHVPYNMLKVFSSAGCEPLFDADTLPAKKSLASFWAKWEATLRVCHNNLPYHLSMPHIQNLAPYILGDACWR